MSATEKVAPIPRMQVKAGGAARAAPDRDVASGGPAPPTDLASEPPSWSPSYRAAKRAMDVAVAAAALAALGGPIALLAAAVRLTSKGPAFYSQERMGLGGRPFRIHKLRTMVDGADRRGPLVTVAGDARVTPIGRLLRKSKLDELPQLWNVLRGDMSLVGPRPEVPRYRAEYRGELARVLSVRPGITDRASIEFRDEESVIARCAERLGDRERAYVDAVLPRKLALQLRYVREASVLEDLAILVETARAVVAPR